MKFKLSTVKGIADFFLFLSVFLILLKLIQNNILEGGIYVLASIFIFMGIIVTLFFLVKQFTK